MNYVIAGMPVKRMLFQAVVAAGSGLTVGTCYRNLRDHPGTGRKILKYSVFGGCFGGMFGYALSSFRGNTVILMMTQTMYWSLVTAYFFNMHSVISNRKIIFPGQEEPIKDVLVTSSATGLSAAATSLVIYPNLVQFLSACSFGLFIGFIGHHIYDQACVVRLEFLLKQNYPELMLKKKEAERYMDEQHISNPYYDGPVNKLHPIIEYLSSIAPQGELNELRKREGLAGEK